MKPTCFLDMDGVVADFVRGAFRLHGRSIPFEDVEWDFCTQLGFNGVNDPAFWDKMGHDFWAGLEWHGDGRQIVEGLDRMFEERVVLMTSPCQTPGCVDGKLEWVRKNLPQFTKRIFIGSAKHLAAGPDKVLLDDYEGNIEKFRAHGGQAIVVPRPWNSRKCHTADGAFNPVDLLNEIGWLYAKMLQP